jgi:hypothetical protein
MEAFEPPFEYTKLKKIYKQHIGDPKAMHLKLLEYKFNKVSIFLEKKPFTIDQVLAYAALLLLVEDFNKLNKELGQEKIEKL